MAELVYILCAATSLFCAALLWRGQKQNSDNQLVFWSALCFSGFALNNFILFLDVAIFPEISLSVWRLIPALFGVCALIYGLVKASTE